MWYVKFQGENIGPFENEEACYDFAAKVSEEANDWEPIELLSPEKYFAIYSIPAA